MNSSYIDGISMLSSEYGPFKRLIQLYLDRHASIVLNTYSQIMCFFISIDQYFFISERN